MIRRFVDILAGLARKLDKICLSTALVFMFLMLACVLIQIVARYILQAPPAWTEELGRYAMIWAVMFGATSAFYHREDPAILKLDEHSDPRRRKIQNILEAIAVVMFVVPVLYYTPVALIRSSTRLTETLEISSAIVLAVIPICFSIILFYSLIRVMNEFLPSVDRR